MSYSSCELCGGMGMIPLPRGMSQGFYSFMVRGCRRREDGTILMLCPCRDEKADCEENSKCNIGRSGDQIT